jgi:polyisoprenoid-binding protein YceI
MKKVILSLFLIFIASAYAVSPGDYFFTSTGNISFISNAPLEIIKASSDDMKGLIDAGKKTFSFRVTCRSFEGFNSELQREHFNEKYMENEKYPEAIFNGTITDQIDFSKNGTYSVIAKGKLNIHGVEKERIIKSTMNVYNEMVHVETKFTVLLDDHNIRIPKIVTQKIATEIVIEVKADLKRKTLAN